MKWEDRAPLEKLQAQEYLRFVGYLAQCHRTLLRKDRVIMRSRLRHAWFAALGLPEADWEALGWLA